MGKVYEQSVPELMKIYFRTLSDGECFSAQEIIDYFKEYYPAISSSTIPPHLLHFSVNAPTRERYMSTDHGVGYWDMLFWIEEENKYRLLNNNDNP